MPVAVVAMRRSRQRPVGRPGPCRGATSARCRSIPPLGGVQWPGAFGAEGSVGRPPSVSGRVPGSGASAIPRWSRGTEMGAIRDIPETPGGTSGSDQGVAGFPPRRAASCWLHGHLTRHQTPGESTRPAQRARTRPPRPSQPGGDEQRLHRAGRGRMLAGVAAGLADYFDVDPTLVRIAFVALAFVGGLAVPLYLGRLAPHPRRGDATPRSPRSCSPVSGPAAPTDAAPPPAPTTRTDPTTDRTRPTTTD